MIRASSILVCEIASKPDRSDQARTPKSVCATMADYLNLFPKILANQRPQGYAEGSMVLDNQMGDEDRGMRSKDRMNCFRGLFDNHWIDRSATQDELCQATGFC